MSPPAGPPRFAERFLTRLLGDRPSTEFLIGDLREEFEGVTIGYGRLAACWWYLAVVLRTGIRLRLSRLGEDRPAAATPTPHRGDLMRTDLSLALRALTKRPVVSTAIVLTIGSALAVATVSFATVNGVLLRDLPYATPDRLVTIWERFKDRQQHRNVVSPANFLTWREEFTKVQQLAALFETSAALTGNDQAEQIGMVVATGDFFSVLGAVPLRGRLFGEPEASEGAPQVVVVAERYWRTRMGADPAVVGKSVIINGNTRQIIGVLPERYDFAAAYSWASVGTRDFFAPWQVGPARARTAFGRFMQVVGRLAPGATVAEAQLEASALAARLAQQFPDQMKGWDVSVVGLQADLVGSVRTPIAVVFGAVCFVLLIASANVANLLMARATERRGEMAIRSALGAGRAALARQLFGESLLLVALGGLVGITLSSWGIAALVRSTPDLPRIGEIRVDGGVIGFALLASLAVAGLVGLGPALAASGRNPVTWFSHRGTVSDRRANRARQTLVAFQIAVSVILLAGAGVLIRSLVNRLNVDLGIDPTGVITAQVDFPASVYRTPERRSGALEALIAKVAAQPGVAVASAASIVPLNDMGQATSFTVLDRPRPEAGKFPVADVRFVHHDFFSALGIRLVAGRGLLESDRPGAPVAVLINETGARISWPGESAVGKRIEMEWGDTLVAEIVGVVGDVRLAAPDKPVERATLYWDYRQFGVPSGMSLVVRGKQGEPAVAPIRAALAEVDPNIPLYNVRSMETLRAAAVAQSRFITSALTLFSALALGLAIIGVYGVMSYGVEQRTREIGVRLALGADRSSVVALLLRDAGRVVAPALAVGLIGALLLTGFLRTLVFGVPPRDPLSLGSGLLIIGVAALTASWIPARRASAIPAVEAIRAD